MILHHQNRVRTAVEKALELFGALESQLKLPTSSPCDIDSLLHQCLRHIFSLRILVSRYSADRHLPGRPEASRPGASPDIPAKSDSLVLEMVPGDLRGDADRSWDYLPWFAEQLAFAEGYTYRISDSLFDYEEPGTNPVLSWTGRDISAALRDLREARTRIDHILILLDTGHPRTVGPEGSEGV